MEMSKMFFRSKVNGIILSEEEYNEKIRNEAKDCWEEMNTDEKEQYETFEKFLEYFINIGDSDFEMVDENGRYYFAESDYDEESKDE